jgi:hypothetical protein
VRQLGELLFFVGVFETLCRDEQYRQDNSSDAGKAINVLSSSFSLLVGQQPKG